jgi:hypothetical protein
MAKILEHTPSKLVIEDKPRIAFGIAISLGMAAFFASSYSLLISSEGFSKDNIFGFVLGLIFSIGGLLLYRETITVFDKHSGIVTWQQYGIIVNKSDKVKINQIKDVVAGRPISDQSGGATQINLILENRSLPLMFGFSATNRDEEISKAIKSFIGKN